MKRLFALLLSVAVPLAFAQTGSVTVTASNLVDSTGVPLSNDTIYFSPVNNAGAPISYRYSGKGQVITRPARANVINGAFTITLPDTSMTVPMNVCFSVTIIDNLSGASILGPGYGCVQPAYNTASPNNWCANGTCNFDDYVPNLAGIAITQQGPTGPAPNLSIGAVTVNSTPTATASIGGANPNYTLNIGLPLAPSANDTTKLPLAGGTMTGPLSVPTVNGELNPELFAGSSAQARIDAALASLSGAPGTVIIPSSEAPGMATAAPPNSNCIDLRYIDTDGMTIGDCDATIYNFLHTPGAVGGGQTGQLFIYKFMNENGSYKMGAATQTMTGVTGTVGANQIVDDTVDLLYGVGPIDTFTNSAYMGVKEDEAVFIGSNLSVKESSDYIANDIFLGNPSGFIGTVKRYYSQNFGAQANGYAPPANIKVGSWNGVDAEYPGVPLANMQLTGTATVTNGSTTVTWVSGPKWDISYMQGLPITVGGQVDSVATVPSPTSLTLNVAYTGTTGTVTWSFTGSAHSLYAEDNILFDLTRGPQHVPDGGGGNGFVIATKCGSGNMQIWIRDGSGGRLTDQTFPRIGMCVDTNGTLHFQTRTGSDLFTFDQNGNLTSIGVGQFGTVATTGGTWEAHADGTTTQSGVATFLNDIHTTASAHIDGVAYAGSVNTGAVNLTGLYLGGSVFLPGTISASGDIVHFSANNTVSDCPISCTDHLGAELPSGGNAAIQTAGVVTLNLDSSTTTTAGQYVCVSAISAGKVAVSSTVCPANELVGFVSNGATVAGTTVTVFLK